MVEDVFDEIETWPLEPVRELESERLRKQLRYLAERSPFYQRKFADAGVELDRVASVDDLPRLPFTDKDELHVSLDEQPPLGSHLAASSRELLQIQATSGTTGPPSFFGLTARDMEVWSEIIARAFFTAGYRSGDTVLHGWGMSKGFAGGVPVVRALQYLGCAVLPIGGEAGADRLLTIADRMRPRGFCTGPNFAVHAGQAAHGVLDTPANELGVERVVVGGEPGGGIPAIRDKIEKLWRASCCEMLGNSDMCPIVFSECDERDGMHLCSQGLIHVELIDPETLDPVALESGARGELVYTALDREASPLIRFRARDHIEVVGSTCSCGRTGPRVRCFGRTDDMLIVRGINVWPSAVQELVVGFQPRATGNLRIIADFEGHSTEKRLPIRIEHAADLSSQEIMDLEKDLEQRIRHVLAFRPQLDLVPSGALEPQGVNKTALVQRW